MSTPKVTGRTGWWFSAALIAVVLILASLSSAFAPGEIQKLAQFPQATEELLAEAVPQAWVEYPLEGQTLPLEPLAFVVYATDDKEVAQVDLKVNGNPLPAAQAEKVSPDGSGRLVRLEQEWKPEKIGEYIVEARGRNSAGGYGEPSFVKFCIGACKPSYDLYVRRMDFSPANPVVGEKIKLVIMIATDIYPSQGPFFPASYFRWRPGPNFPWQEESCPVNAQNASCTKTVEFAYTEPGDYYVEVEADSRKEIVEPNEDNNVKGQVITVGRLPTPTFTRTPTPTITRKPPTPTITRKPPTPTFTPQPPTATFTPLPPPPADIQFWADGDNIKAGSCTTVHWHVTNIKAYWVDGNPGAGDDGSFQTCPCNEETHSLHVIKADNSEQDFFVTIHVQGVCVTPIPRRTEAPAPAGGGS